jgi:hypothetical protein
MGHSAGVAVTVLAGVESDSEDVLGLGAVEEDQRGRKLPRLSPARHGLGGDLEPEACARAPGVLPC